MIENEDLPHPWLLDDEGSVRAEEIEQALEISSHVPTQEPDFEKFGPGAWTPVSRAAELRTLHRWVRIRNTETSESALLRLQDSGSGSGVVISGLVFLPSAPGERVNNRTVRSLPLAAIESAIDTRMSDRLVALKIGFALSGDDWGVDDPLGRPSDVENFYARVAAQFRHLKDAGTARPVAKMAEINDRPAKTVQGWVTEARRRGFLPRGRQGKAG